MRSQFSNQHFGLAHAFKETPFVAVPGCAATTLSGEFIWEMAVNMQENILTHLRPHCCICEAEGHRLYEGLTDSLFGVPGEWSFRKCRNPECGLLWLDPMPRVEDIPRLYQKYYTHATRKSLPDFAARLYERVRAGILASSFGYRDASPSMFWRVLGRGLAWVPLLKERMGGTIMWLHASQRGRLLDIGCGDGKLLRRMRDLGWDVAGVEPDHEAVELIRTRFGLNIHEGLLEEAVFPENTFDTITMHHVLEHLPDPVTTLKQCLRILKRGGRLVLATPNPLSAGSRRYGPDWRDLDPPRHLHLFTPGSIAHVLAEAGFQMELSRTSARCVIQIWSASDRIRHARWCERNGATRQGALTSKVRRITRILKYPLYQIWGSCLLCADPQSGEEILVVAKKP